MSSAKKKALLLAVAIGASALVLFQVWNTKPVPDPSYHGMRLSEWLTTTNTTGMTFTTGGWAVPTEAIRAMGTNAIPYLGSAASPEETPLSRILEFIGNKTGWWKRESEDHQRTMRALEGLIELGKEHPELVRPHLVRAFLNTNVTLGAGVWLGKDGGVNLPILTNALVHHEPDIVLSAVQSIGFVGKPALISLPTVVSILKTQGSTNKILREVCIQAVGKIGHEQQTTAQLLTNYLTDHYEMARMSAIYSLEMCGSNGAIASPQLFKALSDPSRHVRKAAADALTSFYLETLKPKFEPNTMPTNSKPLEFPIPLLQSQNKK